jgi:hypothetical protein
MQDRGETLVPLGLGIFYNLTQPDNTDTPSVTVAHTPTTAALPRALLAVVGQTARLTFVPANAEEVRRLVATNAAEIGLIAPAGFDPSVRQGRSPQLVVLLPESPGFGGRYVAASLDPALRRLAGQAPTAIIRTDTVGAGEGSGAVLSRIGLRRYLVLTTLIVTMICM